MTEEDLHGNRPDTAGGTSDRFDVFAFSAPPRTADRASNRYERVSMDLTSARWATPMSLATPHSEPPITPHDGQTLPLPVPADAQLPCTRYTAESQSIDTPHPDTGTVQRFTHSNLERHLGQEPRAATVSHGAPATAPKAASSSDAIRMKLIEAEALNPKTLIPRATLEIDEHVEDDSPYPIVRACVSNIDDSDMPVMTLRMWAIGLNLVIFGGCINLFLSLRYPSISVSNAILMVVAFLMGKALERIMPIRLWIIPSWIPLVGSRSVCLNPGPFNIKEHGLILIMTRNYINTPYALSLVLTARKHYNLLLGPGPGNLAMSALLNAFHGGDTAKGSHDLSRLHFFAIVTTLYALYHFIPDNIVVNQLFGAATGLGMGVLSFDWVQISLIGSPMIAPWAMNVHIFSGFVLFYWILLPILYYTDTWDTGHLPIMGWSAYDRFAQPYDLDRVLSPGKTLNVTAYEQYSPVYIPISFVMTYLVAFIFTSAVIVAIALEYGTEILKVMRSEDVEDDDVHAQLMKTYAEVPRGWYAGVLLGSLGLSIATIKVRTRLRTGFLEI
ncbi:hypothetical protein FRB90_009235 [Tulasnella sp. 427]|nr:hypothetical protein FRB90_009235 [Tulasnella sp. 427]